MWFPVKNAKKKELCAMNVNKLGIHWYKADGTQVRSLSGWQVGVLPITRVIMGV